MSSPLGQPAKLPLPGADTTFDPDNDEDARFTRAGFMPWDSGMRKSPTREVVGKGPVNSVSVLREELIMLGKRLEEQHASQRLEITALCNRLKEAPYSDLSA